MPGSVLVPFAEERDVFIDNQRPFAKELLEGSEPYQQFLKDVGAK